MECIIPTALWARTTTTMHGAWGRVVFLDVSGYNIYDSCGCYGDLLDRNYHLHPKLLVVKIAARGLERRLQRILRDLGWWRRRRRLHRHRCQQFLRAFNSIDYSKFIQKMLVVKIAVHGRLLLRLGRDSVRCRLLPQQLRHYRPFLRAYSLRALLQI